MNVTRSVVRLDDTLTTRRVLGCGVKSVRHPGHVRMVGLWIELMVSTGVTFFFFDKDC